MSQPWVLLDRDGVINVDSDAFVKSPAEWLPIDGSCEAIARMTQRGYKIAVLTNQSGLARGHFTVATLDAMHAKMHDCVQQAGGQIDAVFYCPHGPDDACDCRKPLPGLFHQAQSQCNVTLEGTLTVGDSLRDLEAGRTAGCTPALVRTGKGGISLQKRSLLAADHWLQKVSVYDDLAHFSRSLV